MHHGCIECDTKLKAYLFMEHVAWFEVATKFVMRECMLC